MEHGHQDDLELGAEGDGVLLAALAEVTDKRPGTCFTNLAKLFEYGSPFARGCRGSERADAGGCRVHFFSAWATTLFVFSLKKNLKEKFE